MPPKPFHSVKPYAWDSLRWTDTICRMKPENEAAMDMIPYVLWHATGMFILNTSATTKLGLIACTDLREDNPFSFDLNFFHDYSILMNLLRRNEKDERVVQLIKRYLKSGVMENGVVMEEV